MKKLLSSLSLVVMLASPLLSAVAAPILKCPTAEQLSKLQLFPFSGVYVAIPQNISPNQCTQGVVKANSLDEAYKELANAKLFHQTIESSIITCFYDKIPETGEWKIQMISIPGKCQYR